APVLCDRRGGDSSCGEGGIGSGDCGRDDNGSGEVTPETPQLTPESKMT
ncbi:2449_t:CDS:2, partial [Diversispora eburnea]